MSCGPLCCGLRDRCGSIFPYLVEDEVAHMLRGAIKGVLKQFGIHAPNRLVPPVNQPQGLTLNDLVDPSGFLKSTQGISDAAKAQFAMRYAYKSRALVALDVAGHYSGGDYFEFGSDSMSTFRSFVSAFDLNGLGQVFPDTRFYAFDMFGDTEIPASVSKNDHWFFEHYAGPSKLDQAQRALEQHNVLVDRCIIKAGYFQETLNEDFKAELRRENRKIGFSFLDCNLSSSYKVCFDFMEEFVHPGRCHVYLDEYYAAHDLPGMYDEFCARVRQRYGLASYFMRNAGSFGALFLLMRTA
jgi:hypothetical protein